MKCDGNHGGPPCDDIECWNDTAEHPYWPAKCRACGWRGSSQKLNGGRAIADTGDYSELRCPRCDSVLIDEADTEYAPNAKVTGSPALSASPSGLPGYATEVEK
jgi:hypothetical protein